MLQDDPLIRVGHASWLPAEYRTTLNAIAKVDPNAVIGGGALRDYLHDRSVKDIDIFVGPGVTAAALNAVAPEFGWVDQFSADSIRMYREHFAVDLSDVIGGLIPGPVRPPYGDPLDGLFEPISTTPPIQVVVMKDPMTIDTIRRMDFGFCQIGLEAGTQWIMATPAWLKDEEENTATLVGRSADDMERSRRRAERLAGKYPERRFVFPQAPE